MRNMDEKLADLDTRRVSVTEAMWCSRQVGSHSNESQSSSARFQIRKQRTGRESYCHGVNQSYWNERRTHSWLSCHSENTRLCGIRRHKDKRQFVRSANMRKSELDGRRIRISPALELDERFDKKRLGYITYVINKKRKGIELYWMQLNLQEKSIYDQWTDRSQDWEQWSPQILQTRRCRRWSSETHRKWLTKKLVATIVSSRDVGMQRRIETVTTRSHEGKTH